MTTETNRLAEKAQLANTALLAVSFAQGAEPGFLGSDLCE